MVCTRGGGSTRTGSHRRGRGCVDGRCRGRWRRFSRRAPHSARGAPALALLCHRHARDREGEKDNNSPHIGHEGLRSTQRRRRGVWLEQQRQECVVNKPQSRVRTAPSRNARVGVSVAQIHPQERWKGGPRLPRMEKRRDWYNLMKLTQSC